ncbi:MAG: NAD(+) synthase [Bacteroidales bacterium]|nr:NAD(+) synthase [Bacteroidales bacterium]
MDNYGFIRVAACSPRVKVADIEYNTSEIISAIDKAEEKKVSLLVFPELCVTGYTCGDLFSQDLLISEAEKAVVKIKTHTRAKEVTVVVGVPVRHLDRLYNCAAVIRNGMVRGLVPKLYVPNYGEFYESRWFSSGADFLSPGNVSTGNFHDDGKDYYREGTPCTMVYAGFRTTISPNQVFSIGHASFAVEICEDLWMPVPPSSFHALCGARIIVNTSASNEVLMKHEYRKALVANQSARTISGYIYCSSSYGESTQDMVFAGSSLICENGTFMAESERFSTSTQMIFADLDMEKLSILRQRETTFTAIIPDGRKSSDMRRRYSMVDLGKAASTSFEGEMYRHIEPHPFVPGGDPSEIARRAEEITSIQVMGLMTRLEHIGCKTAVIGISGGLDSTLALLVTVLAFDRLGLDRKGIIGITMPGFGTTGRTHRNAVDLMTALGVTQREISIVPCVTRHFEDIGQDPSVHDVTYENAQARERTQILMDVANKENGLVVGTGDLSELALGWATYNGDHMSMYGVNASIPKTLVKYLVKWAAENNFGSAVAGERSAREILLDVVDTPISPELTPADDKGQIKQKTEDLVGPYELHDFFLYNMFRFGYSPSKIFFMAKKAFIGKKEDASVFLGPEGKFNEYDEQTILKWLKKFYWRFFSQQFKRSCLPDGPKVGSVSLSPRGDLRMPSDAKVALWIADLEKLQ